MMSSPCIAPRNRAIEHARAGLGPYLIECKTFRMTGHSAHDPADYVPKHLWAEWAEKDPIAAWRSSCWSRAGRTRRTWTARAPKSARKWMRAIAWAEKSPYPDASELLDSVYEQK